MFIQKYFDIQKLCIMTTYLLGFSCVLWCFTLMTSSRALDFDLVVILAVLTKPLLSEMLFDNFSLWKLTTFCIHCSPVAGESGWMYIRFGISGSAFPATIHRLLWNLYRQSSTATKSINNMYFARLSKPETLTLQGGNILLKSKDYHWNIRFKFFL